MGKMSPKWYDPSILRRPMMESAARTSFDH